MILTDLVPIITVVLTIFVPIIVSVLYGSIFQKPINITILIFLMMIIFMGGIGLSIEISRSNYNESYTAAPITCFNDTVISKYDYNGYHFDTTDNSYTIDNDKYDMYYKLRLDKDYKICVKRFNIERREYVKVVSLTYSTA